MKKLLLLSILFTFCQIGVNDYEYVVKNEDFRDEVLKKTNGEYVELSDGYTYFEQANQNSKLGNVVLVHGYSIPSYIMGTTFSSLKEKGYRVVMMDLFGRGFSDNPDLPQTDFLRANQVIELMEYIGIENAALVGLSNGGRIISKIADLEPNKVNSLFYVASAGFFEHTELSNKSVSQEEIDKFIEGYPGLSESQKNDFFNPEKFPDWSKKYDELLTHSGFAKALISTTKNLVSLDDIHNKIHSLDIPVFAFWGRHDSVVVYDEFKDRLEGMLPNRKEFFIEKSGHLPHMENQDDFEKIFFKYLEIVLN
jgi:pimeloyl-ACP methyl ester carboxylesterase